jgi:hypothetical protein
MHRRRLLALWIVLPLAFLALSCATSPTDPTPLAGQFVISEGAGVGNLICMPIEFNGHSYPFVIDTGTTITALDRSLESQLQMLPQTARINGVFSEVEAHVAQPPLLRFGDRPLPLQGPVITLDLSLLRRASGVDVVD